MKLLIVEDEQSILKLLKEGFEEDDFIVETARDGDEALYMASLNRYDVIILDWMLPQKSGIEVVESLRAQAIYVPIIMLTAKDEIKDRIEGLRCGADDYLSKPFSFEELEARVIALHRRASFDGSNTIKLQNITIDTDKKLVKKDNELIELTSKEYELLLFLIQHKNSYVSKFMIEEQLWRDQEFVVSNVIEVTIFNLRKKLFKQLIKNFRGLGYKIEI